MQAPNVMALLPNLGTVRPIDVSRLWQAAGSGPCAPFQVALNVWIAPECGATAQRNLSTSYAIQQRPSTPPTTLPFEVDLRARGLDGPMKYQQAVGVCYSFALSTVMENALRRGGRNEVIAPLHVISSDVWDDIWSHGQSQRELTLEMSWPYDPVKACKLNENPSEVWCGEAYHVQPGSWRSDPALVAEVQRADATGMVRISKAEKLSATPANPDEIAAVVATGQTVFATINHNQKAWAGSDTSGPIIPDYEVGDGRHAVVIVGYRGGPGARQFLIHNSWSAEWRDGGYAWLSERMIRQHTTDLLTVEVTAGPAQPGAASPSTPAPWAPSPQPGAGTCPTGQVRDIIVGACAAPCPDGSPRAAGLCSGAPAHAGCPSGQVLDWGTQRCQATCPNGLPPFGGACLP